MLSYIKKYLLLDEDITTYIEQPHKIIPRKDAIFITAIFGVFGLIWILLSDRLLALIVTDVTVYIELQTYKGWLYVFLMMGLIYTLVNNRLRIIKKVLVKISEGYEELEQTYEELVATEEELHFQKEFIDNIINEAPAIIVVWDELGMIRKMNPYGLELLGYTENQVINTITIENLLPEDKLEKFREKFTIIKQGKDIQNYESEFITKNKKRIYLLCSNSQLKRKNIKTNQFIFVGKDITERKELEEQLFHQAYYDSLTGIGNKFQFEKEMKNLQEIEPEKPFAILYIDFDNFKNINDTLGHHVGDLFLTYVAKKLTSKLQSPSLISRIGGDEFAILLFGYSSRDTIETKIREFLLCLGKTWTYSHHQFYISVSIGIALYPEHGSDLSVLFKNADIAMYEAKNQGKGRYFFYTSDLLKHRIENVEISQRLQEALLNEEFTLYYQPQLRLHSNEIIGVEVLTRWFHKTRGAISPMEFIPIAEETGQIYEIEAWIIKNALLQKGKWENLGIEDFSMSINLSSKTLSNRQFFMELEQILSSIKINYHKIVLEITETALLSDDTTTVERLLELKKRGIRIALDDFGTGYSSLTHLKNLPIDIVKLDRTYIKNIEKDQKDAVIIKAILKLAHDLQYEVIAEGIETIGQFEFLKKYQCQIGQGYLFSKPISIEELETLEKFPHH